VPAVGDDPERGAEPPRVLERVVDWHLVVACSPEHEARAANAVEVLPRVVPHEGAGRADRVRMQLGSGQQPVDGALAERGRI
jgi:hypothetical protein